MPAPISWRSIASMFVARRSNSSVMTQIEATFFGVSVALENAPYARRWPIFTMKPAVISPPIDNSLQLRSNGEGRRAAGQRRVGGLVCRWPAASRRPWCSLVPPPRWRHGCHAGLVAARSTAWARWSFFLRSRERHGFFEEPFAGRAGIGRRERPRQSVIERRHARLHVANASVDFVEIGHGSSLGKSAAQHGAGLPRIP